MSRWEGRRDEGRRRFRGLLHFLGIGRFLGEEERKSCLTSLKIRRDVDSSKMHFGEVVLPQFFRHSGHVN